MTGRWAAAAVGTLALACTAPTATFVEDEATGAHYSIPQGWEQMDLQAAAGGQGPLELPDAHVMRQVFFPEGATPPQAWPPTGDEPVGLATAWTLTAEEQEEMSIKRLRNEQIPIDRLLEDQPDSVTIVQQDLLASDGYRGERIVVTMRVPAGSGETAPATSTFTQTTYLDPFTETAYVFAIGCSLRCYEEHQQTIDGISASWSVIPL